MTTMLVIIHVVVCVFLTLVVLLQQGAKQGLGGLGGGGSSASLFGGRGANTFLQKLTAGAAAMFMVTSLLLSYLSSPRGVMDGELEDDGVQKVDTNKADGTTEFYVDGSDREVIESVIVGKFKGWTGNTKVKLENGQVWQQAESGKSGFPMESPRVKVKPMSLGSWLMYVDGCGCDIRVKRVE